MLTTDSYILTKSSVQLHQLEHRLLAPPTCCWGTPWDASHWVNSGRSSSGRSGALGLRGLFMCVQHASASQEQSGMAGSMQLQAWERGHPAALLRILRP